MVCVLIRIGDFEFTSVWDGVFYKKLSRYPAITDWEKWTIIEFVEYEASYGRVCKKRLCRHLGLVRESI